MATRRISDERLESAYVDPYGYDPRIHGLFLGALERLKDVDRHAFALVRATFERAFGEQAQAPNATGPDAVETLCHDLDDLAAAYQTAAGRIIDGFRAEMLAVILADDARILDRRVPLRSVAEAFPTADLGTEMTWSGSAPGEPGAGGAAAAPATATNRAD